MFKRVDEQDKRIEGFSYSNRSGDIETVSIPDGDSIYSLVTLKEDDDDGCEYMVYREDIPMLIKALQASYDFKGE